MNPFALHYWYRCDLNPDKQKRGNQLGLVPYEWSVCDSPSSSPPLSEPEHQQSADPRPEKDRFYNQSAAPFTSCKWLKTKGVPREDVVSDWRARDIDRCGRWEGFSHQTAASQDNLPDLQSHISWAQLLGKAKNPRMQHCQYNLNLSADIFSSVASKSSERSLLVKW